MKMTKIKKGKLCVGNDCRENSFFEMKNESSNNATPKDNMDENREYLQQFIPWLFQRKFLEILEFAF